VTRIVTVFLCSVERRFSVPADVSQAVARSLGQAWRRPPAKPARSGLDAGEHRGSLIEAGVSDHRAPSAAGTSL
jgi:hypothetical protein